VEGVENADYVEGDFEPCVHCADGTAIVRVATFKCDDPSALPRAPEAAFDELASEFPGEKLRLEEDDEAPRFSVWGEPASRGSLIDRSDIIGAGDTIEEAVVEARRVLLAWGAAR
jgi:hypothetical protein